MGHIYMIKNKKNGKIYIGQTIRPIKTRLEEHRTGRSSGCRSIYNAIKKHGWENFEKDWYECPDDDLNFYEEMLVALLGTLSPSGYNLRGGGSGGKMSEETKQKNREAHLGKTHSEETKHKITESSHLYGKVGEKHPMYGKTHSDESKQKMSESKKGDKHPKSKIVYQYDLDDNLVQTFGSGGEAGRHLGKHGVLINECARSKNKDKTAYGFKWSHSQLI